MKNAHPLTSQNVISNVVLIKLEKLKPIEKIFTTHLQYIQNQIENTKVINKPLIIDNTHHIILDGSHRYAYLKKHGYKFAPVIMVDYNSSLINVGSNLIHRFINSNNSKITKEDVLNYALTNRLFSPRTTRHFFPFTKKNHPIKLDTLIRGNQCNIDYLISEVSTEDEIKNNQNYLQEIENELELIGTYIQEQQSVKQYLKKQIENMQDSLTT